MTELRSFVVGLLIGVLVGAAFWACVFAFDAAGRPVTWHAGTASWYDVIALSGGPVACRRSWPGGMVVAHRSLPCGTRVRFLLAGRKVTARVLDRGPFVAGREWDMDVRLARALGFPLSAGVISVRWRVVR